MRCKSLCEHTVKAKKAKHLFWTISNNSNRIEARYATNTATNGDEFYFVLFRTKLTCKENNYIIMMTKLP